MNHLTLHGVQLRKRATYFDCETVGFPQQSMFVCFDLKSDPETFEHEPAMQVSFSGFQCLGADKEVLEIFKRLDPESKWTMIGFGALTFSKRVITTDKWTQEDSDWVKGMMTSVMAQEFGLSQAAICFSYALENDSPQCAYFMVTRTVAETEWNGVYHSKSLEMSAATKYFELMKGVDMPESPLPIRTLN